MKKRRIFSLILAILLVLGTTACSTTAQDKVKSVNVKKGLSAFHMRNPKRIQNISDCLLLKNILRIGLEINMT